MVDDQLYSVFRTSKMSSPSVYEPLFVNTDIEYELDWRLFPGINDPQRMMEPKLLIHGEQTCRCIESEAASTGLYDLIDSYTESETENSINVTDASISDYVDDLCDDLCDINEVLPDSTEQTSLELSPLEVSTLLDELLNGYVDLCSFPLSSTVTRKRKCSVICDVEDVPYKRTCYDSERPDWSPVDNFSLFSVSESMCRGS